MHGCMHIHCTRIGCLSDYDFLGMTACAITQQTRQSKRYQMRHIGTAVFQLSPKKSLCIHLSLGVWLHIDITDIIQ